MVLFDLLVGVVIMSMLLFPPMRDRLSRFPTGLERSEHSQGNEEDKTESGEALSQRS